MILNANESSRYRGKWGESSGDVNPLIEYRWGNPRDHYGLFIGYLYYIFKIV